MSFRTSLTIAWALSLAPLSAQTWQSLAGPISGTPYGVGPQPFTGSSWFASTSTGDYRSNDNGLTWTNVSGNLLDDINRIISSNFYFRSSTGRLFRVGDNASWSNRVGSPIWYSDNNGASWNEVPLPFGSPTPNPAGISITAMTEHGGALFASDQLSQGVWKSTDNGLTWTAASDGIAPTPFTSYKMNSSVTATSAGIFTTTPYWGVFRSTDGGASWQRAVNGIPGTSNPLVGTTHTGRDIVAFADGTLFANIDDHIYRSTNGGDSWTIVTASLGQGMIKSLAAHGGKLYAFTANQILLESTDGGGSFVKVDGGTPPPLRTSNVRQLGVNANTAVYSSGAAFFRLDFATSPRVSIAPAIVTQPVGKGVNVGGSITLSVTHSNATLPITYQWKRDGAVIPGATGATYTIASATEAHAGSYTVEVTNSAGTAPSSPATVHVEPASPGHIDYTVQPLTPGNNVFAAARAADGTLWFGGQFNPPLFQELGRRVIRLLPDGSIDPAFAPTTATFGSEQALALFPLSDGSILVGGGQSGGSSQYLRKLLPNGAIDSSFDWPNELGGSTFAIVPGPGDTSYVAGTYGIYRIFNHNGNIDFSFNPPRVDDFVRSIVIAPDGKILIGGDFSFINNLHRNRVARLHPDGTLDVSFSTGGSSNNGFNGDLLSIALQKDGKVVAIGAFTSYRGTSIARVARLLENGDIDPAFTPPTFVTGNNGRVLALALDGQDRIVLGGAFTQANGQTRNNIARLNADGTLDETFPGRPANLAINTLVTQPDGNILVGTTSTFYRLLGAPPAHPSLLSFTPDVSVQPGQNATFTATLAGPSAGASWKWFKDGQLLPAATSSSLSIPSVSAANVGRYHVEITLGSTVLKSPSSRLDLLGVPYFIHQPSPAPGYFGYRHHLSAKAAGTGPISYQWYKDGAPVSGATGPGFFFPSLAAADAGTWFLRATNPLGSVDSAPFHFSVLPRHGSVDPSFRFIFAPKNINTTVSNALLPLPGGGWLLGGSFDSDATGPRFLFRLYPDGTIDSTFDSASLNLTTPVRWLFRQPATGKIIVGTGSGVVRLNPDLSPDASFAFPNAGNSAYNIQALLLLADGRLLVQGGSSANIPGYPSKLYRTTVDGAIDTAFPSIAIAPANSVDALAQDGSGRLLLAGSFTAVAGAPRNRLARLSLDGVLDTAFTGPAAFNSTTGLPQIHTVSAAPDGTVFLGGRDIATIGSAPAGHIARFDAVTGAHDPGFFPTTFTGSTHAIRFLPDGRLALAGNFSTDSQNNKTVYQVLYPNGAPDRRALGLRIGHSAFNGTANDLMPSLPGTHLLPGFFNIPDTSLGYAVRFFTGDVDLAFVTHPVTGTATTPPNTVTLNANVTLTAAALGTSPVSYQWHFNGSPIPGATSPTLSRNPVQKAHEGTYTLVVANASGSVASLPMYLDVLAEPEILAQPSVTYNPGGSTATLAATVKGAPTLSYSWQKDGVTLSNITGKITGATTTTLTIQNLAETDSGAYRLIVTNTHGTTFSLPADVVVNTSVGTIDTSWNSPNPFVNSSVDSHPARLLPGPDGGFFIGANFFGFSGTGSNPRFAAQFDAAGDRLTAFAHNSISPLESYSKVRWASHPDGILFASASAGINSAIFRFTANGAAVPCGNISGAIEDIAFDSSGRLLIATASTSNGNLRRFTVDTAANTVTLDESFATLNTGTIYGLYPSPATGGWYVAGPNITSANNPGLSNNHATTYIVRVDSAGVVDPTFSHNASGQQGFSSRPFLLEAPGGKVHFRNTRLFSNGGRDAAWNEATLPVNAVYRGFFLDGKLLVAVNNTVRRLLDTGNPDPAFSAPVVGGTLNDILATPTGHLYAIGNFNASAATNNRVDLIRLNIESPDIGFTAAPADLSVDSGQSATFTAVTYGAGLTHKWYHNGQLVANGGRYSGATTSSLTIANATPADNGSLRLEISNAAGLRSRTAFLTVNPPPATGFSDWDALENVPANQRGPLDKPDGDGIPNLIKYALGLTPGTPSGSATVPSSASVSGTVYPAIVFKRRQNIEGVDIRIIASSTLPVTDAIETQIVSVTDNGDGTETVVARTTVPVSALSKQFLSVEVTQL